MGLGSPEPTDIANTNCLTLIGSHLGENMHNLQVQEFAAAVERRIPIIVVDPRFSVAASKAKHWLPIKPGTDLALILAWMNVIVEEGLYDRAFVDKHGHGFDKFAAEIKPSTPEWAAAETGIDAALIRTTAREMARFRPASLVHPGRRVNWNGDDTQRSRAIAMLNALLGNWARKGGLYYSQGMKVAGFPLPKYPQSAKPAADNPNGERYPFADEAVTTGLREATLTGKPFPIKGWWVYSSNIVQALPNQAETLKAIQALDLLVVVDTLPSEIAGYADVVLPEVMFLERYDELVVGFGRQGWMSLRQPVVPPPGDQKPGWWMAKELAAKLGIPESMPFKDIEEYLAFRVEKSGYSWQELKKVGVIMGEKKPITVEEGLALEFPDAVRQGRVLVRPARRQGLRPGAEVQGAAGRAGGLLQAHLRPRARAHVQPHPDQPAAARPDARERALDQRRHRREARCCGRAVREAPQPGWRGEQPHPRESDAAHPSGHVLHGVWLRPREPDAEECLS